VSGSDRASRWSRRALAVAGGLVVDRLVGEPPASVHPVVWLGRLLERAEAVLWRDARLAGVGYGAVGLLAGAGAGALAGVAGDTTATLVCVALAVAGRALDREAAAVHRALAAGRLEEARARLPALVGRDTAELDPAGIARAVVESLAENTVDAVVAPVVWALAAGPVGATLFRAINTMDALVGHRSPRYRRFGWASARLDDLAAWLPARVTAAAVVAVRPGRWRAIRRAVRDDARWHPSPNAGVAEAAFAAALDLSLGGPLHYGGQEEVRPRLGTGPTPDVADIGRARRLATEVEMVLVGALLVGGLLGEVPVGRTGPHRFGAGPGTAGPPATGLSGRPPMPGISAAGRARSGGVARSGRAGRRRGA